MVLASMSYESDLEALRVDPLAAPTTGRTIEENIRPVVDSRTHVL
jgi:hypothetical protein